MKVAFLLLFISGLLFALIRADSCTFFPNSNQIWLGSVNDLQGCINSISFSSSRASNTIAVLRNMVDLYSFTDIVKNSGQPWNLNVDLDAGLTSIASKSYTLDYEFHTDLTKLFNSLNDAHTWYGYPVPYSNMAVIRPFGVRPVINNGDLKFYLTQPKYLDPTSFNQFFGFNPTQYYGSEVTAIDGTPIVQWFKNYADQYVSNYKDQSVRFNAAIKTDGSFIVYGGDRFSILEASDSNTFTINGQSVSVPNMGVYIGSLSSVSAATSAIDTSRTTTQLSKRAASLDVHPFETLKVRTSPDIHREKKERLLPVVNDKPTQAMPIIDYGSMNTVKRMDKRLAQAASLGIRNGNANNLELTSGTSDGSIWRGLYTTNDGNNVPVLRISSFAPDDINGFLNVLNDFAVLISNNNFDYVLVDVSGNGGGIICLAHTAMSILSQSFRGVPAFERYDLRRTASNIDLHDARFINGSGYLRVGSGDPYGNDESWFNARQANRGGQTSDMTQFVYYPAECLQFSTLIEPTHYPTQLLFVTDGTCGSACSLFLSKFVEYNVGQVVSYGGFTDTGDMDTSSFAGGNVLNWPDFVTATLPFPLNSPPQYSPTSSLFRFNFHEMYMGESSDVPREFRRMAANYHMYFYDPVASNDYSTADGTQALVDLYESSVAVWGSFTQTSAGSLAIISNLLVAFVIIFSLF